MFLSLLGQTSRTKNKRPTGFYQPLQEFCHKSEGCSPEEEGISAVQIGRRVVLSDRRVGTLRYYGPCSLGEGQWAGVELDTEDGDHDGLLDGLRYFACPPRRGLLLAESEVSLVPQVRYISEVSSSGPHSLLGLDSQSSTPGSPPLSSHHSGSAGSLVPRSMEVPSKHSSFELDESLGILTPDQMSDFTLNGPLERSPSAEELSSFMLQDVEFSDIALDSTTDKRSSMEVKDEKTDKLADLPPDASEISESAVSKNTQTSNSARSKKESRVDRTPSLEDLPLDSAGDTSTEKTESYETKSKAPNSFITSITSITSLDNGYQGDGEWSRPASRGPEHSPTGKGCSVKSRLDPMTDSDFFTESDADMTEEWGHRRAQVIDGTLYNAQPSLAAQGQVQRFSPSNEEMDSSGIYSDLEKRPDEQSWIKEEDEERPMSPEGSIRTVSSKSDQSLKKVSSPTSFSSVLDQVNTIKSLMVMNVLESDERREKKTADSSNAEKSETKTFKAPKRNVSSKIKILTPTTESRIDGDQESRVRCRPVKKSRWDAVMSKIAQGQAAEKTTPKLKEVKSKVYSGISNASTKTPPPVRPSTAGCRKAPSIRGLATTQSMSSRSLRDLNTIKSKSRRTRIRSSESSLQDTPISLASSRNSSVSDLTHNKLSPASRITKIAPISVATENSTQTQEKLVDREENSRNPAPKGITKIAPISVATENSTQTQEKLVDREENSRNPAPKGSGKKRDLRCTSPQSDGSTNSTVSQVNKKLVVAPARPKTPLAGKNVTPAEKTPLVRKTTPRRGTSVQQHKPQPLRGENQDQVQVMCLWKNQNHVNVGCGGTPVETATKAVVVRPPPPVLPPPPDPSALQHAAKGAQALALLVQHLVVNLDAFSTPQLKADLEKTKAKWLRSQLELEELKVTFSRFQDYFVQVKKEKEKELEDIENNHKLEVDEMHSKYREEMDKLTKSFENSMNDLQRKFELAESRRSREAEKRLEEAALAVEKEKSLLANSYKKVEELEAQMLIFKEAELSFFTREGELLKQVSDIKTRYENLKEGLHSLRSKKGKDDKKQDLRTSSCSSLQAEVDSLQCVLEIRCGELQDLRRKSQTWKRDATELPAALQRLSTLTAKVEDLQAQLARKEEIEKQLLEEKQILSDTVVKESTQKKRLSLLNEELQWKLKQNSLVFNAIAGISNPGTPKSQKTLGKTPSRRASSRASYELNKTASEADINFSRLSACEKSPPGSPTVKSVIEKADSVSWVLDLEEPPESIASRILKRAASRSRGSPSTPRLSTSPLKVSWEPQTEEENITEEVIMVKGIGGDEVLELLSVDDSEIYIDDLPKRRGGDEAAEMLRRVGERGGAGTLPKDSAGEAMISGEGSDDEPPSASESEGDEEEEEETTSSGGDLSETRLFRLNGASDSGSLNMSWAEDVDILPSEG